MQEWRLGTIVVVIFLIVSAIFYRPFAPPELQSLGDLFILASLWMFAVILFMSRTQGIGSWTTTPMPYKRHIRFVPLTLGAIALYILADRNVTWIQATPARARILPDWMSAITVDGQMALFCVGVILVLVGLLGINRADIARLRNSRNRDIMFLVILTIVGFIIRSWDNINTIRGFIDEGPFILAIRTMREEPYQTALLQPIHYINAFSYIYSYIERIFSDMFGSNLGVFRLTSALFGALTIPATYWLARELFDRPTAWLAAVFLMTFPPHIHFSRIGMNNIADPLFGVLAFASLIHAIKHPPIQDMTHEAPSPKRWMLNAMPYYAFSGIMLGLLPYFYEGGELMYPMLVVLWLMVVILFTKHKPRWRGIVWLVVGFTLVSFPNYVMLVGNGYPLFSRVSANQLPDGFWQEILINENGLNRLAGFFQMNVLPPILHIFHLPDGSVFYGGETPLILSHFVPLFFLGIFHIVLRPRPSGILLLIWVMLTVLGNSLILHNTWSARFVVVFPALVIIMAVGLRYTLPMLPQVVNPRLAYRGAVALATVIVGLQGIYYFKEHIPVYHKQISYGLSQYDVMFQTLDMPPGSRALVLDPDYLQYLYMKDYIAYIGADVVLEEWSIRQLDTRPFPRDVPFVGIFIKWWDEPMIMAVWDVWELAGPYPSPYVQTHALDKFAFFRILSKK